MVKGLFRQIVLGGGGGEGEGAYISPFVLVVSVVSAVSFRWFRLGGFISFYYFVSMASFRCFGF